MLYRIHATSDGLFEVWGKNPATGYEWLIAEFITRQEARDSIHQIQQREDAT
jgi:hypothetical protein